MSSYLFAALKTFSTLAVPMIATSAIYSAALAQSPSSLLELAIIESQSLTPAATEFGYRVEIDGDEAAVSIYNSASSDSYEIQSLHCHAESDPSAPTPGAYCHDEGRSPAVKHVMPAKLVGRAGFNEALKSGFEIFKSRIAKLETVRELKIWQHDDKMTLRITAGDPAAPVVGLFVCDLHGAAYDCHRTRKTGPNEPAN